MTKPTSVVQGHNRAGHVSFGVDQLKDFVFIRKRDQQPHGFPSVPFVQRSPAKAASLDVQTRRKKIRLLQEIGADESVMQQFVPSHKAPLRQYFHSRTNAPMLEGEWDLDSDDESDDHWLHKMSEAVRILRCSLSLSLSVLYTCVL